VFHAEMLGERAEARRPEGDLPAVAHEGEANLVEGVVGAHQDLGQ
jgi:hypothetical protein